MGLKERCSQESLVSGGDERENLNLKTENPSSLHDRR